MTTTSRRTVVRAAAWSTPAVALATTAPAAAAGSALTAMTFAPGTSGVAQSGDGTWRFIFAGATITGTGAALQNLSLRVTFVPDSGNSNLLSFSAQAPAGWFGPTSGTATNGTYVYTGGSVADGVGLAFPDGSYFGTAFSSTLQKGSLVLTFSATGFQDIVYSVRVPGTKSLTFDPGSSYVAIDSGQHWGLSFQGASVGVHGGDLSANAITMTVTFTPDAGFTGRTMSVKAGGPAGWSAATAHNTLSQTYTYGSAVTAGNAAPVGTGAFFYTLLAGSSQPGTFNLVFSATGYASVTYKIHGPKSLSFDPAGSAFVPGGNDTYAYRFQGGASVTAHGVDLPASAVTMTASFLPDPGFSGSLLAHTSGGPVDWTQYPQPAGELTTISYTYSKGIVGGSSAPISDGAFVGTEYSVLTQQGRLRWTVTAPELQPVVYDAPLEVALSLSFSPGSTYSNPVGGSQDSRGVGYWALIWGQAAISPHGATLPPGALALTVTFQADDGSSLSTPLYQGGSAPPGWTVPAYSKPGPTARIVYLNGSTLAPGDVITLNGEFFTTNVPASQYPGQMVTTFSAAGFTPVTATWSARPLS